MSDDSKYTFRMGTYGSGNALKASYNVEASYIEQPSGGDCLNDCINNINRANPRAMMLDGTSVLSMTDSKTGTVSFGKMQSTKDATISIGTSGFKNAYKMVTASSIVLTGNLKATTSAIYDTSKLGTIEIIISLSGNSGSKKVSKTFTWIGNGEDYNADFSLTIADKYLDGTYTLDMVQFVVKDNVGTYQSSNVKYSISNVKFTRFIMSEDRHLEEGYIKQVGPDGAQHYVYLMPWELKHVDSITMSVSGSTSVMGIPNKPSSRTQIFDTAGPVRTFTISGRRYDWEEAICNWDFINTQFNFAKDDEYGANPSDSKGYYCYIGMNWLFGSLQTNLKGYLFYIGNDDTSDNRFIYFDPRIPISDGAGWNVAITAFNAQFSDTEPGVIEYTITVVERRKYGDALYKPYKPMIEVD